MKILYKYRLISIMEIAKNIRGGGIIIGIRWSAPYWSLFFIIELIF